MSRTRKSLRQLVGKTISKVNTTELPKDADGHPPCVHVDRIVFTDGSRIIFTVAERRGDYAIECTYFPAPKSGTEATP